MKNNEDGLIEFLAFSPALPDSYDDGQDSGGGCCSFIFVLIAISMVVSIFQSCFKSFGYSYYNDPVAEAYKGGEPNYADGDLEDKLGDSGYYYDLFSEERDGEPDDYGNQKNSNNTSKKYNSNFNLTDAYIRNIPNYNTRTYKVYGAVAVEGKLYYINDDGSFYRGWKEEKGYWYYFDPKDLALCINTLKDIDGKVYYFNSLGHMVLNTIVELGGYQVTIDEHGWCSIVNG